MIEVVPINLYGRSKIGNFFMIGRCSFFNTSQVLFSFFNCKFISLRILHGFFTLHVSFITIPLVI